MNVIVLGREVIAEEVAVSVAWYRPDLSALRPIRPEKATLLAPPCAVRVSVPFVMMRAHFLARRSLCLGSAAQRA